MYGSNILLIYYCHKYTTAIFLFMAVKYILSLSLSLSSRNVEARKVLKAFSNPIIVAFSDNDPVTRGGDRFFKSCKGAEGQSHVTLKGGHFIQEDSPKDVAEILISLMYKKSKL